MSSTYAGQARHPAAHGHAPRPLAADLPAWAGAGLRDQLSAYDAIYVAMAEATGATLLTRDTRLARATGHRARVELV